MSKDNTIRLKDYSCVYNEYDAENDGLFPGKLIEVNSNGNVQEHASASGVALPMFALEDELQGKDIDETYAAGDKVNCWIPNRGDEVRAVLVDGENVAEGDFLESDGNGNLQAGSTEPVAIALEGLDLSGSSAEETTGALGFNKRIDVRIL